MTPWKNSKTDEKHVHMWERRLKRNTIKINDLTQRDKTKGTNNIRKTNQLLRQEQTAQPKQDIPKQQKIYQPVVAECAKKYQQLYTRENNESFYSPASCVKIVGQIWFFRLG